MREFNVSSLARVNPAAQECSAVIRQSAYDFQVIEQLPFEPDGEGGHVMLLIEKNNTNTDWLAKKLAEFVGVDEVAIGYAGLKDRHAVTQQWFTVKTEGVVEPDWSGFDSENWQIKTISRHKKKLKRGVLSGNHFRIRLTDVDGALMHWQQAFEQVRDNGVPNYYGEQRFGGQNLQRVNYWFETGIKPKKRHQRSLYLSSARSWLFNLVLSERITLANWNRPIKGDVMQLSGSHSIFPVDNIDTEIEQRVQSFDIHPTGPLWGRGKSAVSAEVAELETDVLTDWHDWLAALERQGLNHDRRALRVVPEQFEWLIGDGEIQLSFFLPAGSYATTVLRELAVIRDAAEKENG